MENALLAVSCLLMSCGATTLGSDSGVPDGSPADLSVIDLRSPDLATLAEGGVLGCVHQPNDDLDNDGWTVAQGDCNDCDAQVNPNAVEFLNGIDDDCNGVVDDLPQACDSALAIDDSDPMSGAKAIELCRTSAAANLWGVVTAKWVLPDGTAAGTLSGAAAANYSLGYGMLSGFGPNVHAQDGLRLLGLSSGTARRPSDPGYQSVAGFDKGYTCNSPAGYPKESPLCPGAVSGPPHDGAALEVKVRVPSNAQGFSVDSNFFTYEWPSDVCSSFNDFALMLVSPAPAGHPDGNVLADVQGNPLSINGAMVNACGCMSGPPCMAGGRTFACPFGDASLIATGFGQDTAMSDHGSTQWLRTTVPAIPNTEVTVRFAVYDSGDGALDTTTLFDHWQWIASSGVAVSTTQIANPK